MNTSDLIVEVRDIELNRVAQLTEADLASLIVAVRNNDVGSWSLTLPDTILDPTTGEWTEHAAAKALRKEGAGLIVTTPDGVLISGPMTGATYAADASDLTGKWTFTGVSDLVLLADALAFPEPAVADPSAQSRAYDKRTATPENLIREYVLFNIGNGAMMDPPRRWAPDDRLTGFRNRLIVRVPQGIGSQTKITKSPRFQNLLTLCQEIALMGGVNFDIVQIGNLLELQVTEPTDRTKTARMDMANQLLTSVTYGYGAPSTTVAVVAGQGEGKDRKILARSNSGAVDSETRWGRRVERFFDQRNTDVDAELNQKGDEELIAGAATATGVQAAPTDHEAMVFLRDWATGDRISVVIEGQEVPAVATEAAISVSGSSVVFVATLGDPGTFDSEAASGQRTAATDARLSALERDDMLTGRLGTLGIQTSDWNTSLDTGFYWSFTGGTLNAPVAAWCIGQVQRFGGVSSANVRVIQTVHVMTNTRAAPTATYRRMYNNEADTWTAWDRLDEWAAIANKPSSFPTNVASIADLSPGLKITSGTPGIADLNSATATGFYVATGTTLNTPQTGTWWNVTVENGGTRSTQYARTLMSAGAVWKRWNTTTSYPATWSPWVRVLDERTPTVSAGGTGSYAAINQIGGQDVNVTLPSGRFTSPPYVTIGNRGDNRLTISAVTVTSTSIAFRVSNWFSQGTAPAGSFNWIATQFL